MSSESGMKELRSAKTFYAAMRAVGMMEDYHAVALAYALVRELHDEYLLKSDEYNFTPERLYIDELEMLKPLIYDGDFNVFSYSNVLHYSREDPRMKTNDAIEHMMSYALRYTCGIDEYGNPATGRGSLLSWIGLMDEIKNTYRAIRRRLPEWKERESLPHIKLNVALAVGWEGTRLKEFPWRTF